MEAFFTRWNLRLKPSIFFIIFLYKCNRFALSAASKAVPTQQQTLDNCNSAASPNSPDYFVCKPEEHGSQCRTYAMLRTSSYYSSLANLSLFLGLTPKAVAEATGFSATTGLLPKEQPLLLPIDCKCNNPSGLFQAELVRTTVKGDSFHTISESLEGLTTCKTVVAKNPSTRALPSQDLGDGAHITVPLKCSCPAKAELSSGTRFLISYPVKAGDTLTSLASYFKVSKEAIISANNNRLSGSLKDYYKLPGTQPLVLDSSVLIPVTKKPVLVSPAGPQVPKLGAPALPSKNSKMKKKKKKASKVMITAIVVAVGATAAIAIAAGFVTLQQKRNYKVQTTKNNNHGPFQAPNKLDNEDPHPFNLSIRTMSEKKLSFEEGSHGAMRLDDDGQMDPGPEHKALESYTVEEISRGTDDFDSHNQLVEGPTYHGRIRGKEVAVRCIPTESFPKVDFGLFQEGVAVVHDPNILRLHGACFSETTPQSFLVFEYAKNGSLKDWIHGGLAVKSQFIASCSCFLSWGQRLRVCLGVARGLEYMHHVMSPPYVHRNIKTRNVFLDEEFRAKIGNFGTARCVEHEDGFQPHLQYFSEKWNSWNRAYMAPELMGRSRRGPAVATSVDVYAYGVVLLEVLSGQKPVSYEEEKAVFLSDKIKAVSGSDPDEVRGWMDSTLGESYSLEGAMAVARLARACVEVDPRMRPSAVEIVHRLSGLVEDGGAHGSDERARLENEGSSKPLVDALPSIFGAS